MEQLLSEMLVTGCAADRLSAALYEPEAELVILGEALMALMVCMLQAASVLPSTRGRWSVILTEQFEAQLLAELMEALVACRRWRLLLRAYRRHLAGYP